MAEDDKQAQDGGEPQPNPAGGNKTVIDDTPIQKADPDAPSAEKLNVTEAQFEKYFDAKTGQYNWQAHAREQDFQASQKSGDKPGDNKQAPASDAAADKAVSDAGLNMDDLNTTLATDGKLNEEQLAALEKVGIPRETATEYASFILDKAKNHVSTVESYLGGEKGIATIKNWMVANLQPEEIQKYEAGLQDPKDWRVWADSAKAKAGVRAGNPGQTLHGANAQGGDDSAQPFADQNALNAAIADPRYKKDKAYRDGVLARARATDKLVKTRQTQVA